MADQAGSGSLPAVAELLGYLWGLLPWWQWQTGTEKFTRCMWVKGLNFLIGEKGGEEGGWWCINEGQYPSEKYQAHSPIATGMAGGNADWHSSSSVWTLSSTALTDSLFEERVNALCFHCISHWDLHCFGRWKVRSGKRWSLFSVFFFLFPIPTSNSSSLLCA